MTNEEEKFVKLVISATEAKEIKWSSNDTFYFGNFKDRSVSLHCCTNSIDYLLVQCETLVHVIEIDKSLRFVIKNGVTDNFNAFVGGL